MATIIEFVIDRTNIGRFVFPNWQRIRRDRHVSYFQEQIAESKFLSTTVITVNEVRKEYRVINGGHRVDAIKKYIEKNPTASVKVHLEVHNGLNEKEERTLFNLLAKQVAQGLNDLIYIHREEIPLWKMIKESFPMLVSIYQSGTPNSVRFKTLLDGLHSCSGETIFITRGLRREDIIEEAKRFGNTEYKKLAKLFELYIAAVGMPLDNRMYSAAILVPLINIYMYNTSNAFVRDMTDEKWIVLFKRMMQDHIIISLSRNSHSAAEVLNEVRERILRLANHNKYRMSLV